jgi:TDG/mug DNA glycosylase family protein
MDDFLPDILGPRLAVVFCGLNPGATAATSGHHFSSGTNRFWRTIHLAGFTPVQIDPHEDRSILDFGCGLTTVVARPTRSAAELVAGEFVLGAPVLERKIRRYKPRALAFLGKAAYAAIVGKRDIDWGSQSAEFGGAAVWVLPNPSGLNRAFSASDLVERYRALRLSLV